MLIRPSNLRIFLILDYYYYTGQGFPYPLWLSNSERILDIILDDSGNGIVTDPNPNLLLTRPTVSVYNNSYSNLPSGFDLKQNYPNPFNPSTTISYSLNKDSDVIIRIFDLSGKLISTLLNNYQTNGEHTIIWNGTDNRGNKVAGGVYLYQLRVGDFIQTKKMVLMK